jgi:hypothetical protein
MKAHNGRLLNECADMLATKGVHDEPRECPIATVRVVGEDVDNTTYELQDGEETPTVGKDGEGYPEGKTYVLKAHSTDNPFRKIQQGSPDEAEMLVQGIEESLKEVREISIRVIQASEPESKSAESEDEETFPMPEEYQESSSPQFETGEAVSQKLHRMVKFWTEQVEWETRPRPEWWSPAWEELAETRNGDGSRIPTGWPKEFKECITEDVFALDARTMQLREDGDTGTIIDASVDPELINVASAVIWNSHGATMLRKCDRGQDLNDLVLSLFKEVLNCSPSVGFEGGGFPTSSCRSYKFRAGKPRDKGPNHPTSGQSWRSAT